MTNPNWKETIEREIAIKQTKRHLRGLFDPEQGVSECDLTMSTEDVRGTLLSISRECIREAISRTLEQVRQDPCTQICGLSFSEIVERINYYDEHHAPKLRTPESK